MRLDFNAINTDTTPTHAHARVLISQHALLVVDDAGVQLDALGGLLLAGVADGAATVRRQTHTDAEDGLAGGSVERKCVYNGNVRKGKGQDSEIRLSISYRVPRLFTRLEWMIRTC